MNRNPLTSQRWNSSVRHNDIESFCFNSSSATWFFQRYRWIIFAVQRINLFPLDTVVISVPNTYPLVSRFIRLIAAFERLGPDVWRYWVRALKEGNLEKRYQLPRLPVVIFDWRHGCRNINALFTVRVNASGLKFEVLEDDITKLSVARIPAKDNCMIATPEESAYHRNRIFFKPLSRLV